MVRNDLDAVADVESALPGREGDDAVFLTEASDRRAWVANDEAVTRVAGAGIERERL